MPLLALDTSTRMLSLALQLRVDAAPLCRSWEAEQQHATRLLPEIHRLLADAGLTPRALSGIAVSVGPGAFTSLRIGCGVAQGLAWGLDIPLWGISTLEALAASVLWDRERPSPPRSGVVTALDARMNESYLAAYTRVEDHLHTIIPPHLYRPAAADRAAVDAALRARLQEAGIDWVGVGNGFAGCDGFLARQDPAVCKIPSCKNPHAREVLRLAQARRAAGECPKAEQLALCYLRDKVAQTQVERAAQRSQRL